jgi:hypothetical protein
MAEIKPDELIILIISNNELKTKKVFKSDFDIDAYIEEQAEDCALSNEAFSYCILAPSDFDFSD